MDMDNKPHKVTLDERNRLGVTGITEVLSFDENTVILQTDLGTLTVQGQGLKLKTLLPEGGQVTLEGSISAFCYEEPRLKGGWLSRLLS